MIRRFGFNFLCSMINSNHRYQSNPRIKITPGVTLRTSTIFFSKKKYWPPTLPFKTNGVNATTSKKKLEQCVMQKRNATCNSALVNDNNSLRTATRYGVRASTYKCQYVLSYLIVVLRVRFKIELTWCKAWFRNKIDENCMVLMLIRRQT